MNRITLEENWDGELRCAHRDLSVCPACFANAPGLVDVGGVTYVITPEDHDWISTEVGKPGFGHVTLSPGTVI
jgi:hypothetical protein